ncbi:DUF2235 domain-containing protein [Pseudoduganella plicata]|uniref:DUF2235 domain-containing protein n=1 Tax=Pseudoduganella plicata TaxID=321984 RepID=A0A4V1ATB4_9BURK|nr:DUF2235 domain-containing protein [Pseudoduganella plicata]QBQ35078.1 DUF2235 domain-containing protein [Pseudoduganella plicata]GGZ10055.1 hypothetical protein GCM10007388_49440 [Pseudoduganella plicata]
MIKNIVLFMDGTWNGAGDDYPTNVRKLYERVLGQESPKQHVHYIRGIGTSAAGPAQLPGWHRAANLPAESNSWLGRTKRRYLGGAFGLGMSAKIREAYAFLVQHYRPGDQVFLFGFSRGAFAARSLAGFVEEVGLLLREDIAMVPQAYALYESKRKADRDKLPALMQRLTGIRRPGPEGEYVLKVHMIGVWDTVGALGVHERQKTMPIFNTGYHNTRLPENIAHARHALALHELRAQFAPLLWDHCRPAQSLLQVWFAGAHADVGGGYEDTTLSDIALEWMASEAAHLGLRVWSDPRGVSAAIGAQAVHNPLTGCFVLAKPAIRGAIARLAELPDGALPRDLASHAVHQSALDRLSIVLHYQRGKEIAEAWRRIDDDTARMAINLLCQGRPPVQPGEVTLQAPALTPRPVPAVLRTGTSAAALAALDDTQASWLKVFPTTPAALVLPLLLNATLRGGSAAAKPSAG